MAARGDSTPILQRQLRAARRLSDPSHCNRSLRQAAVALGATRHHLWSLHTETPRCPTRTTHPFSRRRQVTALRLSDNSSPVRGYARRPAVTARGEHAETPRIACHDPICTGGGPVTSSFCHGRRPESAVMRLAAGESALRTQS